MARKANAAKVRLIIMLFIVAALCIFCAIAPHFMPNDPNRAELLSAKQAPSEKFPWGTDALGRCVLSRVLSGAATTVFSALLIVVLSLVVGCAVGVICGYFGGGLDAFMMRVVDVFLAFPGMVLALAVAGMLGKGLNNAIIALVATGWCQYARLSRSYVLSLRQENFVLAARLNGQSSNSIMMKHILPNALRPVIVTASLSIGGAMLSLAGLSFLGLGAQAPAAEWGSMLSDGRGLMQKAPWIVLYPSLAIFVSSVLFNLMGDSVRDVLDPLDSRNIFSKVIPTKKGNF
ncbi:MAG: ABC transporter permease [Clostridiales bacterium]|nr:ABC transporter permease [Clostridiales bacterium]